MFLQRFFIILVSCLLAGLVPAQTPDTTLTVRFGKDVTFLPWLPVEKPLCPFKWDKVAGMQSAHAMIVDNIIQTRRSVYRTLPYKTSLWQRFYIKIDSCGWKEKSFHSRNEDCFKLLLGFYEATEYLQQEAEKEFLLSFGLEAHPGENNIRFVFKGKDPGNVIIARLNEQEEYCVETQVNFISPESLVVAVYLDGGYVGGFKRRYFGSLDFFKVTLTNDFIKSVPWRLLIRNFTISDSRIYGIPPLAAHYSALMDSNQQVLKAAYVPSRYAGEEIRETEWKVWNRNDSMFPVFHSLDREAGYLFSRSLPFRLDTGHYVWQVRFRNNFSNWSYWSVPVSCSVKYGNDGRTQIKDVYFSKIGKASPVADLTTGTWYDLHCKLIYSGAWDSLGFFLIYLNDTSYTFGHPGNKGGRFLGNSSYIINFNLLKKAYQFFEKKKENSAASVELPNDSAGLYVDGRKKNFYVDTAKGELRIRMRLLDNANPGFWRLSASLFYPVGLDKKGDVIEERTRMFYRFIRVVKPSTFWTFSVLNVAILLLVIGIIVFAIWQTRSHKKVLVGSQSWNPEDGEFANIVNFIKNRLAEKITFEEIEATLHLSYNRFGIIMSRNQQTLPQLVNRLRIDKAKELLRLDRNKTISEVGFSVGFNDARHFYKTFKQFEGVTPKEFRAQN